MGFFHTLHPHRRAYRQSYIAQGYRQRWRSVDASEIPLFVELVNASLVPVEGPWPPGVFECQSKPRRREVTLTLEDGREYRARLKPGAEPWITFKIVAGDIAEIKVRQTA